MRTLVHRIASLPGDAVAFVFGPSRGRLGHRGLLGPLRSPLGLRAVFYFPAALIALAVAIGLGARGFSALIAVLCGLVTQEVVDRVWVSRQTVHDNHDDASRAAPR
jgi:hypothetical protein